jgi:hypothetical protein
LQGLLSSRSARVPRLQRTEFPFHMTGLREEEGAAEEPDLVQTIVAAGFVFETSPNWKNDIAAGQYLE